MKFYLKNVLIYCFYTKNTQFCSMHVIFYLFFREPGNLNAVKCNFGQKIRKIFMPRNIHAIKYVFGNYMLLSSVFQL